ncbi:unnamed protein product [Arabis nemorensis]|uniref:Uncharacterized protein n=1 Tax=Arabis nemorensis TaxID=586526 RepID=A0A565CWJ2_9BRAS|nr:unnamed protein product [Arabis nemorensis]
MDNFIVNLGPRKKTSRPVLLVFLLVILIVTCQFEWRQQLVELDAARTLAQKQQQEGEDKSIVKSDTEWERKKTKEAEPKEKNKEELGGSQ